MSDTNPTARTHIGLLLSTVLAMCALPAATTEEAASDEVRKRLTEGAKDREQLASIVEVAGASDAPSALKAIAAMRTKAEAYDADKIAKVKAEAEAAIAAEAAAKAKAEADKAEKIKLIEQGKREGRLSAGLADLYAGAKFDLADVRAALEAIEPRGSKPLTEAPASVIAGEASAAPTWKGKRFEQIESPVEMAELAEKEPELHASMRRDAQRRGFVPRHSADVG